MNVRVSCRVVACHCLVVEMLPNELSDSIMFLILLSACCAGLWSFPESLIGRFELFPFELGVVVCSLVDCAVRCTVAVRCCVSLLLPFNATCGPAWRCVDLNELRSIVVRGRRILYNCLFFKLKSE